MTSNITVIITTRNRPNQLKDCLKSLLKNKFNNFSILVADQSTDQKTVKVVASLQEKKIKIFKMDQKGKSKGLNLLIGKSSSEILAFTDDDCIVDKNWLQKIFETYKKHPKIAGVFGNTFPYKPENHPEEICPSTFKTKNFQIHTYKNLHYYYVGLGNNMSIRKSVLNKIGGFQEWLGPGAIGENGEESEIIFRILKNKYKLATNPKLILFHNRWLNPKQERLLQTRYTFGFIAFLSFYLFTEDKNHIWLFIKIKIKERIFPSLEHCHNLAKSLFKEAYFLSLEIFAVLKGILIGLIMTLNKKF